MNKEITLLDGLFSEFIRKRAIVTAGGCERCKTPKRSYKQLQCSHFAGRAAKSVRWDEENAAGLCGACHMYFTAHPFEHNKWFMERLGDRFELLMVRRRSTWPKPDRKMIELYLRQKIKEFGEVA